jgi:hypothetical protein
MTELVPSSTASDRDLFDRVAALIEQGRAVAVARANAALSLTHEEIVASLAHQLSWTLRRRLRHTSMRAGGAR